MPVLIKCIFNVFLIAYRHQLDSSVLLHITISSPVHGWGLFLVERRSRDSRFVRAFGDGYRVDGLYNFLGDVSCLDYWHVSLRPSVLTFCSLTAHLYAVLRFLLLINSSVLLCGPPCPFISGILEAHGMKLSSLEKLMSILGSAWVGERVGINEVWCKITRFWNKRETEK